MKFAIPVVGLMLMFVVGCQDTKTAQPSAMDVNSPAPTAPVAATYTPAPTPIMVADASQTPAINSASPADATGGSSYTVKPGDTLWKISAEHYGDGKKWKQIVDANPGLEPSKLRVGMKITLP